MNKKILVVDDESDILKEVSFILERKGFTVYTGVNGKEAIELAERFKPDLIILDVFMPCVSGSEAGKVIRENEELKHIPIILLTASIDNIEAKRMECMADDYIFKPFDYKELLKKIEKLIK
ncbi:MAG: response regulator [Candidatus Omnitrophica bacterium]|nr:response regulator [Candidatus Omnitrophota bacterium]